MGLRKNKKGMLSMIDALILITVLSIAAIGLFSFTDQNETEVPMAESVSNDLFSMELKASDICDTSDTAVYPLSMLIVVNISEGRIAQTEDFLKRTLDTLIPEMYGYDMTLEYHGTILNVHRDGGEVAGTSYSSNIIILDGQSISYELTIQ